MDKSRRKTWKKRKEQRSQGITCEGNIIKISQTKKIYQHLLVQRLRNENDLKSKLKKTLKFHGDLADNNQVQFRSPAFERETDENTLAS